MAMEITDMEPIAPGNPFHSDLYHMGTYLGSNVCVMYEKHHHEHQPYVILVDMTTGERKRVAFSPAASKRADLPRGGLSDPVWNPPTEE